MKPDDSNKELICPECGAPRVGGLTCWEQLGMLLAWEWQDPELQAEHFLTVASFNLQHPAQFTEEAVAALRIALVDYIDKGTPTAELRRRAGKAFGGNKPVLKKGPDRQPVLHRWDMTIADVYVPEMPSGAALRVKKWAEAIRRTL